MVHRICLPQLFENLVSRWPLNSWFLHHDNAPAQRATAAEKFLEEVKVKLLKQPTCSSDLAPCDFGLFPYVKLKMKSRRFSSDEQFLAAFCQDFIPKKMWAKWFDEWFLCIKKRINYGEKYLQKHSKISMYDKNYVTAYVLTSTRKKFPEIRSPEKRYFFI